jgi:L-phenylalanine/L-methionine N-acetyltransferase
MVRQAQSEDFDFIQSLYFHPHINPFLLYEMDEKAQFPTIFDNLMSNNSLYIFEKEGQKAGMFKFILLAHRNSHMAYLGGVAMHPDFAGQGLGYLMMSEIVDLGRKKGLRRIELSTATTNHKAMYLYEKVGFQKEGILRDYTHLKSENRFLDEVLMSILL